MATVKNRRHGQKPVDARYPAFAERGRRARHRFAEDGRRCSILSGPCPAGLAGRLARWLGPAARFRCGAGLIGTRTGGLPRIRCGPAGVAQREARERPWRRSPPRRRLRRRPARRCALHNRNRAHPTSSTSGTVVSAAPAVDRGEDGDGTGGHAGVDGQLHQFVTVANTARPASVRRRAGRARPRSAQHRQQHEPGQRTDTRAISSGNRRCSRWETVVVYRPARTPRMT